MNPLETAPVRERALPAPAREAIRSVLLEEVAADRRPARPVLVTRRRVLVAAALASLLAAQLWPLPGDEPRFTAWTPHPQALDGITRAEIADDCVRQREELPPGADEDSWPLPLDGWETAVVDRRGDLAMVVVTSPGYRAACTYGGVGHRGLLYDFASGGGGEASPIGDGEVITREGEGRTSARHDLALAGLIWYDTALGSIHGQVAPEVADVEVVLSDGTVVKASVANGHYLAFWPGKNRRILLWSPAVVALAETVRAYDASGQLLEEMTIERRQPPVGRFREIPAYDVPGALLDETNIQR